MLRVGPTPAQRRTSLASRVFRRYSEVPEWVYLILTIFAIILGIIGLTVFPTHTSVSASVSFPHRPCPPARLSSPTRLTRPFFWCLLLAPVFFGIFLCILFVIPIGIVYR